MLSIMSSERVETGTGSRLDHIKSALILVSDIEVLSPGEPRSRMGLALKKLELARKPNRVPEIEVM